MLKRALASIAFIFFATICAYGGPSTKTVITTKKGPTLYWDFTQGNYPNWITPSAGANGTVFNAAGNLVSQSAPRFDYGFGGTQSQGLLIEPAATNVVLRDRDLTNASWTASNVTTSHTATGIDGASNSATFLTASAGNGTVLQSITLGSSARFHTAYVLCVTCTGNIQMTMDNSTYTTLTSANCFRNGVGTAPNTSTWVRCQIPTQTITNPTVGFKIVNNADEIAVDVVQNETGTFATSPIITTSASVTRSTDNIGLTKAALSLLQGTQGAVVIETGILSATNVALVGFQISCRLGASAATQNLLTNSSVGINASLVTGNYTTSTVRSGFAWGVSVRSLSGGGSSVTTDTNSLCTSAPTAAYIGTYNAVSSPMAGHITKIALYNYELPDAVLKYKTVLGAGF